MLPKEDVISEEESPLPTLKEAEKLTRDYEDHTDVRKYLSTLQVSNYHGSSNLFQILCVCIHIYTLFMYI